VRTIVVAVFTQLRLLVCEFHRSHELEQIASLDHAEAQPIVGHVHHQHAKRLEDLLRRHHLVEFVSDGGVGKARIFDFARARARHGLGINKA